MKKGLVLFIAVVYTLLLTGLHIHMHYCGNTLKHFSFTREEISCCPHHEEQSRQCGFHSACCSDTNITLSLEEEHTATFYHFCSCHSCIPSTPLAPPSLELLHGAKPFVLSLEQRPPPKEVPTFVLNCSLVLYA